MVVLRGDHLLKNNCMEEKKSKGLGDTIQKITNVTGLSALTNMLQEKGVIKDCGCKERKEKLNNKFPYKK